MRTIYYLGENIDVDNIISVEIQLTSLGENNLNITKFTGDFIHSITIDNPHPTGTEILTTPGEIFSVNIGEIKTVFINLELNNIDSLPTEVYIETEEIGETTSMLIFRGGVDPGIIVIPPILRIQESIINLDYFCVETNKTDPKNQELGIFNIKNIGASDLIIDSINYIDYTLNEEVNKDFISFRDSLGNAINTIPANSEIIIYIDVDSRTSGSGVPNKPFLEDYTIDTLTKEEDLSFNGFIEIISNDRGISNTKHRLTITGGAYAPILGYELVDPLRENSGLIFNYRYNKVNTKDLQNNLKLFNNGSIDLIISSITSNYSITETSTNYPIVSSETEDITILPGESYEFNIEFLDIKRADKLNNDGSPNTSEYEEYKKLIERYLLIRSNAINYTEITDVDYGVAYSTNNALNKRMFETSIWYEESIYSWHPIERNYFVPGTLEPGGLNSQRIQIRNDVGNSSEEIFKVEIVYYGEEVGTKAWLENISQRLPKDPNNPLFITVGRNTTSGGGDFLSDDQDFVFVSLSTSANNDRYTSLDRDANPMYGGSPELIGHIKKKYDFDKDKNPFKLLITRVTNDQSSSGGNLFSTFDLKDNTEYWDVLDLTGLPESLLVYMYATARKVTVSSYGISNISLENQIEELSFTEIHQEPLTFNSFALMNFEIGSSSIIDVDDSNLPLSERNFGIKKKKVQAYSIGNIVASIIPDLSVHQFQFSINSFGLSIVAPIIENPEVTSIKQFQIESYGLLNFEMGRAEYIYIDDSSLPLKHHKWGISKFKITENSFGMSNISFKDQEQEYKLSGVLGTVNYGFKNFIPIESIKSSSLGVVSLKHSVRKFSISWSNFNFLSIDKGDPFIDSINSTGLINIVSKPTIDLEVYNILIINSFGMSNTSFKDQEQEYKFSGVLGEIIYGIDKDVIPPIPTINSYGLNNLNITGTHIMLKNYSLPTKIFGIHKATPTDFPELGVSINSFGMSNISLMTRYNTGDYISDLWNNQNIDFILDDSIHDPQQYGIHQYHAEKIYSSSMVVLPILDIFLGEGSL